MSTLQLEISKSLEGISEDNLRFLLEMINKYMRPQNITTEEAAISPNNMRIGALKGRKIFAPGYDFDEDNEEIAKMFGEID